MERTLMRDLFTWKSKTERKPLIINGARQVGKTWLIKEFGRRAYDSVAYVNMDNNQTMQQLFEEGYDIRRIIIGLELETGVTIEPDSTLIVFDEVQEIPKALTSLKYFCENAPEYQIIAAGSLLGISLHKNSSFPVGKVETLDLYPLTFNEFVRAVSGDKLADVLMDEDASLAETFKSRFVHLLKDYYFVGGMPEAVMAFAKNSDYSEARTVQKRITTDYERDFSKHLDARETEKVLAVWNSLPAHLAQENKKFVFGRIAKGSRAKDYESALTWLSQAGLVHVVPRITKPGIPLKAYRDSGAFKVFTLDVGLLGAMSELNARSVIEGNRLFEEFKGALAEQYVCQQLISECHLAPWYWSAENSRGEIDFIVQIEGEIYLIEVKAEENLRAKSLRSFKEKHPSVHALRFSLSDYRTESWLTNIPLYLMGNTNLWKSAK
ncbi:ATP-binding protein [Gordonibacter massiliensis (ex Traore et al. 2017)]|uniref:ATP-binding protein n=1 Tax=Gordonibacter massiliensis (ex Traore et al. 2017) TaxID=1841863 RepID=A0A842JDM6_9ACTN|nr:AAA family ATPase [Gordonibacter massiliensis (ex Traore et al. 2017)]MBC2888591.1 ATP-binding protein [Gordonibacter massiliensis (ex Traore et al. 2017)]